MSSVGREHKETPHQEYALATHRRFRDTVYLWLLEPYNRTSLERTNSRYLHASHYQARLYDLMAAQSLLLCFCAISLYRSSVWTSHEHALSSLKAARWVSIVGLNVQLIFHFGSPRYIGVAVEQLASDATRPRATIVLTTLWFPYLPFILSLFLLCLSVFYLAYY